MIAERHVHTAPLGLRLWDDGAAALVADDLDVVAAAVDGPSTARAASPGPSGCFVFHALPGLGDGARRLAVTVSHRRGEFVPVRFQCDAPQRGFARPLVAQRAMRPLAPVSAHAPVDCVPLFSAAARPLRSGAAVVRAELRVGARPAAWALVEAAVDGATVGRTVADAAGRALLVFPYPRLDVLAAQTAARWRVTLSVFHRDGAPGDRADLDEVMNFAPRRVRTGGAGDYAETLTRVLSTSGPLDLGALELQP